MLEKSRKREAQRPPSFAYLVAVPHAQFSPHKQGLQEQFDSRFLTVVSMIFVFMLLINGQHKAIAARRHKPYAIEGKIYIIFG
jgi:hypothetical protein